MFGIFGLKCTIIFPLSFLSCICVLHFTNSIMWKLMTRVNCNVRSLFISVPLQHSLGAWNLHCLSVAINIYLDYDLNSDLWVFIIVFCRLVLLPCLLWTCVFVCWHLSSVWILLVRIQSSSNCCDIVLCLYACVLVQYNCLHIILNWHTFSNIRGMVAFNLCLITITKAVRSYMTKQRRI